MFFCGQEPSLELVLDCVIERFPFADWENMSSEPFFAVMSREQVLRLQNCVANFKLVRVGSDFHSQTGRTSPLSLA